MKKLMVVMAILVMVVLVGCDNNIDKFKGGLRDPGTGWVVVPETTSEPISGGGLRYIPGTSWTPEYGGLNK